MPTTITQYGANIAIEDSTASFYLREKALDAVQEQAVDDLNEALAQLNGHGILVGTEHAAIGGLIQELDTAADLARTCWELAIAKTPPDAAA